MKSRKTSLALLAATTLVVAACSNNDRDRPRPPPMVNSAPAVSAIANVTADQDTSVGPVEFGVTDDSTPANQLTVKVSVDGTSLFPSDGVVVGGAGTVRNVTLTPLEAATGTANVTVSVIDSDGATSTRTFSVLVNARAASVRDTTLSVFAKSETEAATPLNGLTFAQDADDPAVFAPLLVE